MAIRAKKLKSKEQLTDDARAWLEDKPCGFFQFKAKDYLADLWKTHGNAVVADHIAERPGTRPALFWRYDAPRLPIGTFPGCHYDGELPEPRKRLGGTGTAAYEVKCFKPTFSYGIPNIWVGIDADDLPLYESEAAYLKRHSLLMAGEEKRSDFEPETVSKGLDWFC
jgi:hypothetical protein